MPTLELLIDASGMTRGASQAVAALDSVYGAGSRVAQTVKQVGSSFSGAFQAAGGTVQIAQGISATAASFDKLNLAAAGFSASRVLLEIGNTARDFGNFRNAVGGASTAMAALGLAVRANPIGAIASVIGLAAAGIGLFAANTSKAAAEWDKLGEAMRRADIDERTSRFLGLGGAGANEERLRGLQSAIGNTFGPESAATSSKQFASATGVGEVEILRFLASQRNKQALDFFAQGGSYVSGGYGRGDVPRPDVFVRGQAPVLTLTPEQQREFLALQYRSIQNRGIVDQNVYQFGAGGKAAPASFPFTDNSIGPNDYVTQSAEDRARVERETSQVVVENMERAAAAAGEIGASFGAAMADVLLGTTSLRQALTGLLQQGVRSGLANVFGSIGSLAGATFAQQQGNVNIRRPGEG